jgi:hypothetical protein
MVLKKTKTKLGKSKRTKKRTQRGGAGKQQKSKPPTKFEQLQKKRHAAERTTHFVPKQQTKKNPFASNIFNKVFRSRPNLRTPKQHSSFGSSNPLKQILGIKRKPVTPLSKDRVSNSYEPNSQVSKVSPTQPLYAVVHPTSTSKRPFETYEVPVLKTQTEEGTYADLKKTPNEYEEFVSINPNYKTLGPKYEEFVYKNPEYEEPVPINKGKGTDYGYLNVNSKTSNFTPQTKFRERVKHLLKTKRNKNNDYYELTTIA